MAQYQLTSQQLAELRHYLTLLGVEREALSHKMLYVLHGLIVSFPYELRKDAEMVASRLSVLDAIVCASARGEVNLPLFDVPLSRSIMRP